MKAAGDFIVNYNYCSSGETKILRPGFRDNKVVLPEIFNTFLKKKPLFCSDVRL
jgi:hypothetical protein